MVGTIIHCFCSKKGQNCQKIPKRGVSPFFCTFYLVRVRPRYSARAMRVRTPGAIRKSSTRPHVHVHLYLGQKAIFRQKKPFLFPAPKWSKNGPKVVKNGQNCPKIDKINRGGPPENPNESQQAKSPRRRSGLTWNMAPSPLYNGWQYNGVKWSQHKAFEAQSRRKGGGQRNRNIKKK